ncbi:MAG: PAP/fibrillin family protein [Oculatellaceae cyanobacterium bins.114]|nr:PAP/fibrillin family protein [Oculatellaceae cyanobacterium bins.114]
MQELQPIYSEDRVLERRYMIGKTALLEAIAGKNRGLLATDDDQTAILAAVAQLEDRNPTARPVEATDKLNGNWRLLYTTSQDLLRVEQVPLLRLGQVYQYVRTNTAKIYNVAEVFGLPYLEGFVSVAARFEAVNERRVDVKFERSIVGLQRLIGYRSVEDFVSQIESGKAFSAIDVSLENRDRQGWLDITYLDDDLRIGRGNEGSVFVLAKVSR